MPSKILLIRPHNVYNYNNYPPLNLLCLGSSLKKVGYEVSIVNCAFEQDHLKTIISQLEGALFVGVTMLTSEVPDGYRIIKFIKEHSSVPVVTGGWHSTLFPDQTAESEYVDYVVSGEGEEHIVSIARMLESGVRRSPKVFPKRRLDLNTLAAVDYSMDRSIERFIQSYLTDQLSKYVPHPIRWLPYESSRGCPSLCTFCINTVTDNNHYRTASVVKVLSEVEDIVKRYDLTHVKFIDDNFFADINRARSIAEGMLKKRLNVTWDAECRCDYFNDRMINSKSLRLFKDSGLVQLTLGVESGSLDSLKLMKKEISPEQAENAIRQCNEYRIVARSSFILEIPGETFYDIRKTISFINRMRRYPYFSCGVGTFRPYPRCELTTDLMKKGFLHQPESLLEWSNKEIIDMYTSAEYIRPWQVNGKYSESASFYLNMQSGTRLGNHQISNLFERFINTLFIFCSTFRNMFMLYKFPFDKKLYKIFLTNFYKKKQAMEKSGQYPIVK